MEDERIIELYFQRSEEAIAQTDAKYGRLCRSIAWNILNSAEDGEECVSDAYLAVWNSVPPKRPQGLAAFLGRITRNLALKRYEHLSAAKRNPQAVCSLEELSECVSGRESIESELENRRIEQAVNDFLRRQKPEKRAVFLRRYWYFDSIDDICVRFGFSQSKTASLLYQMRRKLKEYLESEGIEL